MNLPYGATKEDFEKCKVIISELTKNQEVDEIVLKVLDIVYSKGGNYSEKTIRSFAKTYLGRYAD